MIMEALLSGVLPKHPVSFTWRPAELLTAPASTLTYYA
jgi:hypothetical protein